MSEWIKHGGEGCPVGEDKLVFVKLRSGLEGESPNRAGAYFWRHSGDAGDIVEYKLANSIDAATPEQWDELRYTTVPQSPLETQVGGDHYKKYKIQPIQFILQNNMGFAQGNMIKYASRYLDKNGIEDLEKLIHYANIEIERIRELGK